MKQDHISINYSDGTRVAAKTSLVGFTAVM